MGKVALCSSDCRLAKAQLSRKIEESAGFLRIFLRILACLPSPGTWNLQRPLEPEPGTWPLHRLGATVAEPEPGTSGTCWAGHRGTGTSEPRGDHRRVASERYKGLLNFLRKVRNTAPSHPDGRHFLSVHRLQCTPVEPAGARRSVKTALESRKIWALQVVRTVQLVGKLAFGGAARRAQNGLAELPDAMSDCLRQFGCLKQSALRCL